MARGARVHCDRQASDVDLSPRGGGMKRRIGLVTRVFGDNHIFSGHLAFYSVSDDCTHLKCLDVVRSAALHN